MLKDWANNWCRDWVNPYHSSVSLSSHNSYWIYGVFSFWAAASKGNFSFSYICHPPSLVAQIPASRPKSQPQGLNPSLEAQIPVLRLKSWPWGANPMLKPQIPCSSPKSHHLGPNPRLEAHFFFFSSEGFLDFGYS